MPKVNAPLYSLNGGEVGEEALSRLDLDRMRFAGSLYSNVLPRVVGSVTMRPGLEHITEIDYGDTQFIEYAYSGDDKYLLVASDNEMRIVLNDALVTRAAVSTTVTNGDFSSFTGWSDDSTGSASASVSGGNLVLEGKQFDHAVASQTLTVAGADQNVEHGLRLKVERGPVQVKIGSSSGASDLLNVSDLDDGDHSLSFTPTGANVYLEVLTSAARQALVSSCEIDGSGAIVLDTPWDNMGSIKYRQSIDVVYCANPLYQQREILRRAASSWGIQRYKSDDGPFKADLSDISMTPSVLSGNGTLTASDNYFRSTMIGRMFRLFSSGQTVETTFTGGGQEGDYIRISGIDGTENLRQFSIEITGTFTGTITLQYADDDGSNNPSGWVDDNTYTSPTSTNRNDHLDNVIRFWRVVMKSGDYTSGTAVVTISWSGGSSSGVCRMTEYVSETVANVEFVQRVFATSTTTDWDYSLWSDYDGWPLATEIFGGRVWWLRGDTSFGSVSDAYKSFDDEVEGDSAPIVRSLGSGGQKGGFWFLGLQRLIAGCDTSEVSIRASSYDEPLTAANWFPLDASTRGCKDIRAVKIDTDGIFVQATGTAVFNIAWDANAQDYSSKDLTDLHEHVCGGAEVVAMAVQRRPDTIVWFVLSDGGVRALTYEPRERVIAWSRLETQGGTVSDVAAARGSTQDVIYFAVTRNGTKRLEKLAQLSECRGGSVNCLMDAFKRFTVTTAQTVFDMSHLPDDTEVVVWANGEAVHDQSSPATISGGNVTLADPVSNCTVTIGLPYNCDWKSTKLAYGAGLGTALFQPKRVSKLGLYFVNTMLDGVLIGRDADNLRRFTTTKNGGPLTTGEMQSSFDGDLMPFNGNWDTDSRIYLRMQAPYPATAAALVMQVKTNDNG